MYLDHGTESEKALAYTIAQERILSARLADALREIVEDTAHKLAIDHGAAALELFSQCGHDGT